MARLRSPRLALALLAAWGGPPAAPSRRPRLTLDIDKAVSEVMARARSEGLPRYEESVEVRDRPQETLEERLRGVDLACGASEAGPPTRFEMNTYRSAAVPPHVDFLPTGKALFGALKKRLSGAKGPRYFLYGVHSRPTPDASTAAESVSYLLREGPVPEGARVLLPGTSWDLIASFGDRDQANAALRRLQRGFDTPRRTREDDRLPPWVSSTCRPPRPR